MVSAHWIFMDCAWNYKTKRHIFFHFVGTVLEMLCNRKHFLINRAMKRTGCPDSQSQHWYWNEIEQYMQNSHHLVHKHLALFSPLCISLFLPKCSCEINGESNRWIIYSEVILLVAEEVQGRICAEQYSGALFSKRKFQSNVFDLIMMNLWQWS